MAIIALQLAPRIAHADPIRLIPSLELGGGSMLTPEIRTRGGYDMALQGTARLGLSVANFLTPQVSAAGWYFPSRSGDGSIVAIEAGLRLNRGLVTSAG